MKTLVKLVITVSLILAIALGVYYAYRRGDARDRGESYPFSRAPGDLVHAVASAFESGVKRPDATPAPGPAPEPSSSPAPDAGVFPRARELYQAGEYEQAVPLLYRAIEEPGASGERPRELLARARLFLLLLEETPRGEALAGPPVATLTTAGGDRMFATVTDETPKSIAFRTPDGLSATVDRSSLKKIEIARSPDKKTYLFEERYRARHEAAVTPGDFLDLGRFSWSAGLLHHVTYCLEHALELPGDALEKIVAKEHSRAERAHAADRVSLTADLLTHFWSRGQYTRRALPAASPRPGLKPVRPGGGPVAAGGPPSGIGGAERTEPRKRDREVDRLLEEADRAKSEADEHYMKAQPGSENVAEHRKKAIAGYRKAMALYEKIEERWDVGLDSTFREIQLRLYQMLKDSPVR